MSTTRDTERLRKSAHKLQAGRKKMSQTNSQEREYQETARALQKARRSLEGGRMAVIAPSELSPDEIMEKIYDEQREWREEAIEARYRAGVLPSRAPLSAALLYSPLMRHCTVFINLANRLFPPHTKRRKKLVFFIRKYIIK